MLRLLLKNQELSHILSAQRGVGQNRTLHASVTAEKLGAVPHSFCTVWGRSEQSFACFDYCWHTLGVGQ